MPGTPATSPRFAAPRYSNADPADFAGDINPIVDTFDAKAALINTPAQAGVVFTTNQAAGNLVLVNKLLAADANPAFRINGVGTLSWGAGGASAPDASLYRGTTGWLTVDSNLAILTRLDAYGTFHQFGGNNTVNPTVRINGDAANAYYPTLEFWARGAAGASAYVGSVFGYAPNGMVLQSDNIYFRNAAGTQSFAIGSTGTLFFGSANDTALLRPSADTLAVGQGDTFQFDCTNTGYVADGVWGATAKPSVFGTPSGARTAGFSRLLFGYDDAGSGQYYPSLGFDLSATNFVSTLRLIRSKKNGEANALFQIEADGGIRWGPGAATAPDTRLYRNGAGILRTEGQIQVRPSTATWGFITMQPGNASASGYIELFAPDQARNGYIGYAGNAAGITYYTDRGAHEFSGGALKSGGYGVVTNNTAAQRRMALLNCTVGAGTSGDFATGLTAPVYAVLTPYAVGFNVATGNYDFQGGGVMRIYNPHGFSITYTVAVYQ